MTGFAVHVVLGSVLTAVLYRVLFCVNEVETPLRFWTQLLMVASSAMPYTGGFALAALISEWGCAPPMRVFGVVTASVVAQMALSVSAHLMIDVDKRAAKRPPRAQVRR